MATEEEILKIQEESRRTIITEIFQKNEFHKIEALLQVGFSVEEIVLFAIRNVKDKENMNIVLSTIKRIGFNFSEESTFLWEAVCYGNEIAVQSLLKLGSNPNLKNEEKNKSNMGFPLFYAVGYNNYNIVKLLFEHGADINNPEFTEPLINSAYQSLRTVKFLVKNGAKVTNELLIYACGENNVKVAEYCLQEGISPNINGNNQYYINSENIGTNPLIFEIAKWGLLGLCKLFCKYGVKLNVVDNRGNTLHNNYNFEGNIRWFLNDEYAKYIYHLPPEEKAIIEEEKQRKEEENKAKREAREQRRILEEQERLEKETTIKLEKELKRMELWKISEEYKFSINKQIESILAETV